ncbi:ornithine cyclodeaminase family protein [Haloferacaceae archaeon DSL9]
MRILSESDVAAVLDLESLLPTLADAFVKQYRGEVVRPERPHFPVGAGIEGPEPLGTGLTMPAYIEGADYFATKLASVHPGNVDRDLPTVNATVALTDARTGLPAAYMAGTRITSARTGCIGGLAARELAIDPVRIGVIGAGTQARWQVRAIGAAREVDAVRIYSPSDSRERCAADLREDGFDASAVATPEAAVSDATIVVTATTSTEPTFDGSLLDPGTLVVAVGAYTGSMRELDSTTVDRADRLIADVPEEAAETGDFPAHGADAFTPLGAVLAGDEGRQTNAEIVVVSSVGSAVLDAATAAFVYDAAVEADRGTDVSI